jgi:hypothetical protein
LVTAPRLPAGVPEPLDRELLAWAAGFFDGEGSTIARTDRRRPGYFQLDVSVSQSGRDGVPEVLLKFQRAMLGVGAIYPQPGGAMRKWSAGGRLTGEMTLALMWPWLGPVKRAQAQAALDVIDRQYVEGRYRSRAPRYRPRLTAHETTPPTDARRLELAWAAGFLDAEGYFGLPKRYERRDGSSGFVTRASATQHGLPHLPPDVLIRLHRIIGLGRIERHGEVDDFKWATQGAANVGAVLESVRPWLGSVKVAQATAALAKARSSRVRGDAEHCIRGHLYDHTYVRPDGTIHRRCNTCARARERAIRASQGSTPRRFRNPEMRLEEPALRYAA